MVHNAESGACGRGFERMEIFKLKYTNTKIQIHKYECRIENTNYKYTNTIQYNAERGGRGHADENLERMEIFKLKSV